MPGSQGRNDTSTAWNHFRRTGVILPSHESEIAERLATRAESSASEDAANEDEQPLKV